MNEAHTTSKEGNLSDKKRQLRDSLLNEIFTIDTIHGIARLTVFIIFLLIVWIVIASFFNNLIPPENLRVDFDWLTNFPLSAIILQYFRFFFSANTVILMAVIFLALHLAFSINSFCLAKSFGIQNVKKASSRLLKSAFSIGKLDLLEIEDGQQFVHENKQIIGLLGGPAIVKIGSGNAAVFENAFGAPIVSSSNFPAQFKVDGFVRAIKLFDLREHSAIIDIYCRTRDGVPLIIKNLKPIFSVQNIFDFSEEIQETNNLDHIYWMTYQMPDTTWQNYFFDEFIRQFTLFINNKKLNEIIFMMKKNADSENLLKIEHQIERKIEALNSHSSRKPNVPIFIQCRFQKIKRNLQTRKKFSQILKHQQLRGYPNFKFTESKSSIFIKDSLFQEFREDFNFKMKIYRVSVDWIDTGSLHLPASINRREIWQALKLTESWASYVHSDGLQNYLKLKTKFYLINKIQSYKAHNIVSKGKFNPPNEKEMLLLQNSYARQMKLGRNAYKRRYDKVPKKLENAISTFGLIDGSYPDDKDHSPEQALINKEKHEKKHFTKYSDIPPG
ncbi:MAG: hypothetical protein BGO78_15665 [Chloroflexi bacterium 44-23]|nr:MAG: hypothetical protein BGO78_15665 [Chloroflexi bacterium 44-23]